MAAAQRKRWAERKGTAGTPAKKAGGKKRKMSAEGRKNIAEATRKRWEAYRAQKAAASR
jgi:transposase